MRVPTADYVFRFSVRAFVVFLIILLIWYEMMPGEAGSNAQYNVEAGFQRERSRLFVNSAYALLYRPASERVQAMRDLLITLPAFQEEQTFLWSNPDPNVRSLLQQAQPDYLALVAAVQTLIAHPNGPITPAEVQIMLSHDQSFFLSMDTLITVLQQQIQRQDTQFTIVKIGIEGLCLTTSLLLIIVERKRAGKAKL